MALLLREADVHALLPMSAALEAVEEAFLHLAEGTAVLHPRQRLPLQEKSYLHYMAASDTALGYAAMKIYTNVRDRLRFLVPLFQIASGELAALIEAERLGAVRTGAASGVATKYMARADARHAAILGTGLQARTQLEALASVRQLESVRAYGRDPERRARFAREMTRELGLRVEASDSAELAVRDADLVVTATTSSQPVVQGAWLAPGAHLNAVGANFPQKRELDDAAVRRAGIIAVDSREQSKVEAGDLVQVLGEDVSAWSAVKELSEIVAGGTPGRTGERQVTLFKSNGVAIEDLAVAARVYESALARGLGEEINFNFTPSQ